MRLRLVQVYVHPLGFPRGGPPLAKLTAKHNFGDALLKIGAPLEPLADILADTERYLAEAKATLKSVEEGARLSPGMTKEDAVRILTENITLYEGTLRKYGWRNDA